MQLSYFVHILVLSTLVSALPRSQQHSTIEIVTTQYGCTVNDVYRIMNSSLTDFTELFHSPTRPTCLHWCTNGCSKSPDSWLGLDPVTKISFKTACARHDFSWHNLKRFGVFDEGNKLNADSKLRDGMKELCGQHETCAEDVSQLYYTAVRLAQEPASQHNTWNATKQTKCTIFPGCCADHSSATPCGGGNLPGEHIGDETCVAVP